MFLWKLVNVECKTQYSVITHSNTSNDIKVATILDKKLGDDDIKVATILDKKLGDDVILVQFPLTELNKWLIDWQANKEEMIENMWSE